MTDTDWTHVLLVRHGEVAAEHQDTFYGSAEVALSENGEIGSPLLAAKIVEKYDQPDAVWSSPLSRTPGSRRTTRSHSRAGSRNRTRPP